MTVQMMNYSGKEVMEQNRQRYVYYSIHTAKKKAITLTSVPVWESNIPMHGLMNTYFHYTIKRRLSY